MDVPSDRKAIGDAILHQIAVGWCALSELVGDGKAGKRTANIFATFEFRIQKKLSYVN